MDKNVLLIGVTVLSASTFAAQPVSQPMGASFTLGSSVHPSALSTATSNPAAPFFMVDTEQGDHWRTGILGPIGVGYEVGEVDSIEDNIDELDDLLERQVTTVAEVRALQTRANQIVAEMGQDANLKAMLSAPVPVFPVIYKKGNGKTFTVDLTVSAVGKATFLDDEIDIRVVNGDYELDTNSSVYAKSGTDINLGLGYSDSVFKNESGTLVLGSKLNIHSVKLGRSLVHLQSSEDDNAEDAFSDAFSDSTEASMGLGLDLGMVWSGENYQLGFQGTNLNEPSFDYADLESNCLSVAADDVASCLAAVEFDQKGDLSLKETYVMERQFTAEAGTLLWNRSLALSASYELNDVPDLVGDDYQWATVSTAYYSNNTIIPALRLGYKKNMAGSELSYATAGATLFKWVNLDIAYGLESTKIDGEEQPRSMYVSLGLQSAF